jgi:hypothetical protein
MVSNLEPGMKINIERREYQDGGWGEFEKKKGKHHGRWRVFFPDGKLMWERHHVNGREHGTSRTWNRQGRLLEEKTYQDNVLHGRWKEWNAKGRLMRDDSFAFGERTRVGGRRKAAIGQQNLLLEPFRRRTASQSAPLRDRALKELKLPAVLPVKRKRLGERERVSSWIGLVTHAPRGRAWPSQRGEPFVPLLQIRIDELPAVPPGLKGIAFMALLAPANFPVHDGQDELVIWTANSLSGVMPLDVPRHSLRDKPQTLSWKLEPEYPSGNDLPPGLRAYLEDHAPRSAILRRSAKARTRVGGWPGWLQWTQLSHFGEIILQFDTADVYDWMPNGNPNFFLYKDEKSGKFRTFSECY